MYNESGDFLADFYITPEMFNSHFIKDILDDVNNIGKEVEESLKETPKNGGEAPAKKKHLYQVVKIVATHLKS